MKYSFFLCIATLGFLLGCRPKQEPIPELDPRLRINSIHFPGIADKDIIIDQLADKIYVTMPPSLNVTDLTPTIEISDDAKLGGFYSSLPHPYTWCYPEDSNLAITLHSKTLPFASRKYIIKPKPSGPLTIANMLPLPVFSTGDSDRINIDLLNLYGNSLPTEVIFTNRKTTAQITWKNFNAILNNKLSIWAYSVPFFAGEYEISLKLKNGASLKVPYLLNVIRGKIRIEHEWYKHATQPGGVIHLTGRNLQQDHVKFQLISPKGAKFPISSLSDLVGNNTTIQIPSTIAPGYYGLEIIDTNQSLGANHRISILRYENQPFIISFNNPDWVARPNLVTDLPITLHHKQKISLLFTILKRLENYVVALVSESNPSMVFQYPLTLPIEAPPYFIIEPNIPSGRYKAVIQEINPLTKETIVQSEPFERPIIIE